MPWDECRRETTSHLRQNDWIPKFSISSRSMSAATKWTRKIFARASGCGSGKGNVQVKVGDDVDDRRAKPRGQSRKISPIAGSCASSIRADLSKRYSSRAFKSFKPFKTFWELLRSKVQVFKVQ